MRWYYPVLVLLWNAAIYPAFLPGRPAMWAMMAFVGLLIAVVSRAVTKNARFVIEPSITKPLLVLTGVVVATGLLTGGFGVRMLGSGQYGGKHYFYFLAAVAGYFVFTSRRIPPHQAGRYVAMYFLAGLTSGISILGSLGGIQGSYLWLLFPPAMSMLEPVLGVAPRAPDAIQRVNELAGVGAALYVLPAGALWHSRGAGFDAALAAAAAGLGGGRRDDVGIPVIHGAFAILFAVLFFLEGLHRTRLAAILLVVMLLGGAVVLPQADKLPLVVQRALSFLPGNFDYEAQRDAAVSSEWRIGMWKQMLPELPNCFFRGRGWSVDAREFGSTVEILSREDQLASVILVGNFHNGPLSVLIPFGLYGVIAFVWFLVAGLRVLHRNWKFGNPELRRVNTLLLAAFTARTIFFVVVYGSLETDMAGFVGLLGLSVALNGAVAAPAESAATEVAIGTEYIKA